MPTSTSLLADWGYSGAGIRRATSQSAGRSVSDTHDTDLLSMMTYAAETGRKSGASQEAAKEGATRGESGLTDWGRANLERTRDLERG